MHSFKGINYNAIVHASNFELHIYLCGYLGNSPQRLKANGSVEPLRINEEAGDTRSKTEGKVHEIIPKTNT